MFVPIYANPFIGKGVWKFGNVRSGVLFIGQLYFNGAERHSYYNKKRRNATKPGFQRFNQVFMWQE